MADRKTFVLVHGAFHGGWCWVRVADQLRAQGHRVFTPTLTGLGERAHLLSTDITLQTFADDILGVIRNEELEDVILVGHSFGGAPISIVAEAAPERLRHLVYLDCVLATRGKSVLDSLAPEDAANRRKLAQASGSRWVLPPDATAFGVTDPADIAWVNRRLTPHPFSSYESPLNIQGDLGNDLPCTYIACMDPPRREVEANRAFIAGLPNFKWVEIATGHDAMISAPRETAALLLAA